MLLQVITLLSFLMIKAKSSPINGNNIVISASLPTRLQRVFNPTLRLPLSHVFFFSFLVLYSYYVLNRMHSSIDCIVFLQKPAYICGFRPDIFDFRKGALSCTLQVASWRLFSDLFSNNNAKPQKIIIFSHLRSPKDTHCHYLGRQCPWQSRGREYVFSLSSFIVKLLPSKDLAQAASVM